MSSGSTQKSARTTRYESREDRESKTPGDVELLEKIKHSQSAHLGKMLKSAQTF